MGRRTWGARGGVRLTARAGGWRMTETEALRWHEAVRVCIRRGDDARLAEYLTGLPEGERAMLLDGIGSEVLRAHVNSLLRRRQEQLALI